MDSQPQEVCGNQVDFSCWVQRGSPEDIYCANFDKIVDAIREDGAVSRNELDGVTASIHLVRTTVCSDLFRHLSQMPPDGDRYMDPKHLKTDALSVWSKKSEGQLECSFLAKKDTTAVFVKHDPIYLCAADQVLELLLKCSDNTKKTQCDMPDCSIEEFDYVNVVAAVMGVNMIKPSRPLFERVVFFPLGWDGHRGGATGLTMGNLLLPKIKSGSLRLANMGLMHDMFLHQFVGVYMSDFLPHLAALMEKHKKMTQLQEQHRCIKFY